MILPLIPLLPCDITYPFTGNSITTPPFFAHVISAGFKYAFSLDISPTACACITHPTNTLLFKLFTPIPADVTAPVTLISTCLGSASLDIPIPASTPDISVALA